MVIYRPTFILNTFFTFDGFLCLLSLLINIRSYDRCLALLL